MTIIIDISMIYNNDKEEIGQIKLIDFKFKTEFGKFKKL